MLALTMTLRNLANEPVSATSLTGSAAISGSTASTVFARMLLAF
jgi:hypothetical protein